MTTVRSLRAMVAGTAALALLLWARDTVFERSQVSGCRKCCNHSESRRRHRQSPSRQSRSGDVVTVGNRQTISRGHSSIQATEAASTYGGPTSAWAAAGTVTATGDLSAEYHQVSIPNPAGRSRSEALATIASGDAVLSESLSMRSDSGVSGRAGSERNLQVQAVGDVNLSIRPRLEAGDGTRQSNLNPTDLSYSAEEYARPHQGRLIRGNSASGDESGSAVEVPPGSSLAYAACHPDRSRPRGSETELNDHATGPGNDESPTTLLGQRRQSLQALHLALAAIRVLCVLETVMVCSTHVRFVAFLRHYCRNHHDQ